MTLYKLAHSLRSGLEIWAIMGYRIQFPMYSQHRKIDQNMIDAVFGGYDWSEGTTSVEVDNQNTLIYLHDNLIACKYPTHLTLFDGRMKKGGKYNSKGIHAKMGKLDGFDGFYTNTTKRKLNALLDCFVNSGQKIYQKNFKWFVQLTEDAKNRIPFYSGIALGY